MQRNVKDYFGLLLKGMGMGAADVVPGVSGGTIAFISGIYEELINSIKSFNIHTLKLLVRFQWGSFWKSVNGNFLLSVITGIGISILSLAKLLQMLLKDHPVLVWSFFFGLIIASAYYVGKTIKGWKAPYFLSLGMGVIIAYGITVLTPAETPDTYVFLFLTGALAICAMILPGISGAFILLLLSKYEFALEALTRFKLDVIAVMGLGAAIGLISFSNILSWLLKRFHNQTIALLSGFMLGSLNKVWPWKETVEFRMNSHGEQVPLIQKNILPGTYEQLNHVEAQLLGAILLAVAGVFVILIIEKLSAKLNRS